MRRSLVFWAVCVAICVGCSSVRSTNGPVRGVDPFLSVALAVAVAGANRAINGDCWAYCQLGTKCNHKSGFCEAAEQPLDRVPAPYPTAAPSSDEPGIEPQAESAPPALDAGADAADTGDAAAHEGAPGVSSTRP